MKHINQMNWMEPDTSGEFARVDPEAWRDAFLAIRLHEGVPSEIVELFEAARGCMIYGWFFSPLMILGVEQCYRLLEAAVRVRCMQLELPVAVQDRQGRTHALSFSRNLRQLIERGAISKEDATLWKQAGELRHWAALPEHPVPVGPDHASTALTRAASLLNRLFE